MQPKRIIGMCNPLLDMTMVTETKEFLDKHNLKEANAILVNEVHPIFKDMLEGHVTYSGGGSALNTMRGLKWMLGSSGHVDFIGCIGNDDYGKLLTKVAHDSGVNTHFDINQVHQTGCCASIIYNKDRSLVGFVSAAGHYSFDHYQSRDVQEAVNSSDIIYTTGFFSLSSYASILAAGQYAAQSNKYFMLNLSAPFVTELDNFYNVLQYADIVVGNEHESLAVSNKQGWGTSDNKEIALKIAQLPKINQSRKRMVIITQGKHSTLVCEDDTVTEYPVPAIDPSLIVDTNGAGDSFVAGFLAGFSHGKPIRTCVDAGHYCAGYIIKGTGIDFASPSEFQW
jgi:adenosine kinase